MVTTSFNVISMTSGDDTLLNTSISEDNITYYEDMGSTNASHSVRVAHPGPYGYPGMIDPMVMLIQDISSKLSTYAVPAYCVLGILGNFLSCALLARSRMWSQSAAHYLIAIQASDIAHLMNLLIGWLGSMGVPVYMHGGMCHFTTFLSHGSTFLSVWYLACFSVDGFIRICFPEKTGKMCTVTRANVVILALAAVAIAVFINISITFGVTNGPHVRCAPLPMFIVTLQTLFKIDIFLNTALPDIAIIYLLFHACVVALYNQDHFCGSCKAQPSPPNETVINRVTQQQTERHLEIDYRRLYFLYVTASLCLNITSQVPRVYYTVYGLLYPNVRLTMRDFVWQDLLVHTYYFRCCIHFLLLMCFSQDFRFTARKTVVAIAMSVGHLCKAGNSVTDPGNGIDANDDETVTSLMKDTNSTTPV